MNLKALVYIENQKKEAQARLGARLKLLKEKGSDAQTILHDAALRMIKAEIRKSDFRLASISAQHKLNEERAQAKIAKLAAEKAAKEAPQEEAPKAAPEKKEKKAKKAKAEGQEGAAKPKKEKKEPKEPKEPKVPKEPKEPKEKREA